MKFQTLLTNVIIFAILLRISGIFSANILVGYAISNKSHLGSITPLLKRLANAGHNITILHVTNFEKIMNLGPRIHFLPIVMGSKVNASDDKEFKEKLWTTTFSSFILVFFHSIMGKCHQDLASNHTLPMVEALNAKWDMILYSDLFNIHTNAIAQILHKKLDVPFAHFWSTFPLLPAAEQASFGQNWVTTPALYLSEPNDRYDSYNTTNFLHRLNTALYNFKFYFEWKIFSEILSINLADLSENTYLDMDYLSRHKSIVLKDSIDYLIYPQPQVYEAKSIGAYCDKAGILTKEYLDFVDDPNSKGTIYVGFGTYVPWNEAPLKVKKELFAAFEKLKDYRIVFSFNGKFPEFSISSHIKLVKWVPQLDLLNHPKTKLFLTHGGMKSLKESLCTKTPMLALPIFAEQAHNAKLVLKLGIGSVLNKFNLNQQIIYNSLIEVLENEAYLKRLEKLQQIFVDRPIKALDEAEFFVSQKIRRHHQKMPTPTKLLERKGINLFLWQHLNFDIAIVILVLMIFIMAKK